MSAIGILIPYVDQEPWRGMRAAQSQTWIPNLPASVRISYYTAVQTESPASHWKSALRERLRFGRKGFLQRALDSRLNRQLRISHPSTEWSDGEMLVGTRSNVAHLGAATLAALECAYWEWDVEYIFRSNTSSYINGQALVTLLSGSRKVDYGGWVEPGSDYWGWDFVNGAGIILSRRTIGQLLRNRGMWDHRFIDDVAIGRLLLQLGIKPQHIRRPFIRSMSALDRLTRSDLSAHHIRLRTHAQPRNEGEILRLLHDRVATEGQMRA